MEKIYREKSLLKDHKERIKMKDEIQMVRMNKNKENMIGRLINWKFEQASIYIDSLKYKDSMDCLKLLVELWGDTGWDRGESIFGKIVSHLVEFIRLKEGWSYEEFYDEEEEIDAI